MQQNGHGRMNETESRRGRVEVNAEGAPSIDMTFGIRDSEWERAQKGYDRSLSDSGLCSQLCASRIG